MESGNGLHQMTCRMIAEIRRDVSDLDPTVGCQAPAELVQRLVEHAHFFDAELCMPVSDGLTEVVAERVEHRVVRVN